MTRKKDKMMFIWRSQYVMTTNFTRDQFTDHQFFAKHIHRIPKFVTINTLVKYNQNVTS